MTNILSRKVVEVDVEIDEDLFEEIRKMAIECNTTVEAILSAAISQGIEIERQTQKLEDELREILDNS
jgi:post-segregation antitoxin (ccd killing protein)